MKAATFASIMAVSLAGVACSEKAPAEGETEATTPEASQPAPTGQFNLRFPTESSQPASSENQGQFNLRVPGAAPQAETGLRLPPGAVRDNALSDIEEIRTPGMIDDAEALPEEDPEDAIIRLD